MRITIKKNLLYFSSGVVVGYLLGCTTFMILLIVATSLTLIHRKKIGSFYLIMKKMVSTPLNNHKLFGMINTDEPFSNNSKIEAFVNSDVIVKINEYCQWAHIEDMGFFIEKSAQLIFEKDKDWKAHQRSVNVRVLRQTKNRPKKIDGVL